MGSNLKSILFLLIATINANCIESHKILVVAVLSSRSTKNFYEPLIEELANRGHKITAITPYKASNVHKNIRDVLGPDVFVLGKEMEKVRSEPMESRHKGLMYNQMPIIDAQFKLCRAFYESPNIQGIFNETFDLVLSSYTLNECGFGLIHHFRVPFILMHFNQPLHSNNPTGLPFPISFLPTPLISYTDKMDFYQRTINFGVTMLFNTIELFYRVPRVEAIYREFLGQDVPSAEEIAKNVSLIFANSHFSLNFPRPSMPDVIEVGGMHCKPAKELPANLKTFVESSGDDGFIFFSMGSVLTGSMMPEESRKAFLNAFSKIKQNVLWKWETETMEGLPKNVKLSKWLPQQDILGHKNIRAFITHGGLHSTEEAVYHGVPLIGIPIFADQDSNMKLSEHFGIAVSVEFNNITEQKISKAISKILEEPKYRNNAKKLSAIFRDRQNHPLEEAVFHVEYVLRHNGAHHLRSPARDLNFIQYHSLDVIALLTGILIFILTIIYVLLRFCLNRLCTLISPKNCRTGDKKSKTGGKENKYLKKDN